MSLIWGKTFHVNLTKRFEEWLEELHERHPHYTREEILFAAVACGLDWLRHDTRLAKRLKTFYPPETTAERFPFVAIRILAGRVGTYVPKRAPRIRRGLIFGDGCGPW